MPLSCEEKREDWPLVLRCPGAMMGPQERRPMLLQATNLKMIPAFNFNFVRQPVDITYCG